MAKAFDPKRRHDYVLVRERDLPTEQQTVFFFRRITVFEDIDLNEKFQATKVSDLVQYGLAVLRRSLTGWKNYPLEDTSEDAPFTLAKDGYPDEATISRIGADVVELFTFALSLNGVTKDAVGKSSRQSTQLAVPRTPAAPTADAIQPASAE